MALSGSFYGTTTNPRVKPRIDWVAEQSVTGNYSDVTATLFYSRTNNTSDQTAGSWVGSLTIGGDTRQETKKLTISYNSNTRAITHTVRIYHDDHGQRSITISATGGIAVSSMKETSISAQVVLDTIPRASAVSAVDGTIGSRVTVVIDRKSDAFSHSVSYRFGTEGGYIKADGSTTDTEEVFTAAVVNFLLPESFYYQIPDAPSGVCELICRTYRGESLIGTQTATFRVTADKNLCAPVLTGSVSDVNPSTVALTGDTSLLVAGRSTARVTVSIQAQYGATITERTVNSQVPEADICDLENVPRGSILLTATDSRGYTTRLTLTPDFIPYEPLSCTAAVHRTDPTAGSAELTVHGKCFSGSFGDQENQLIFYWQAGDQPGQAIYLTPSQDGSYRHTVQLEGLSYTAAHPVVVALQDRLSTYTANLTLERGVPVFHWGAEDFAFTVPVSLPQLYIGSESLEEYIKRLQGG